MKILGIGESVIDKVRIIQDHPKDLRSLDALESQHIGGPVLAALILLSRLNLDCTFLTSIGKDNEAEIIKRKLEEENVKLIANLEEKTKLNTIMVNSQNGRREKLRGTIKHSPIKDISTEFIRQFDLIIMDRHERKAFYEIISKKKPSAKIVIDPSTEVSDFTCDMIRFSDYPIIPIEFLIKIGEGKGLLASCKKIFRIAKKIVIVTTGELGTISYDGKKIVLYPGISVNTVDATGAGDIYRGAFAYGITQKWEIATCISYANTIAALQCTRLGNASAIPTKNEIDLCGNFCLSKKEITIPIIRDYYTKIYQTL